MIPIARPIVDDEEIEAVARVLRSGILAHGPEVEAFEREFAEYIGVDYAVAVSSGTAALDLILKAYRIRHGDEVITTPFTFIATANAILYQGARPVFADIDPETYNLDPDKVLELITPRTRAIIAVHLYGHPADMKPLREIAEDHNLILIEDAAQAHGAEYMGKKVGSLGDVAAFSFYPTKNMTTGEGGMVTTSDKKIAERIRLLRNHGQAEKYLHTELGYNLRMTSIAAAIGRVQLRKLEWMNQRRRENAETMTKILQAVKGIEPPVEKPWVRHVYHQYVIRVTDSFPLTRDQLAEKLRGHGIATAVHYPRAIPDQPLYKSLGIDCPQGCPEARRAARQVLSLPVHPAVTIEQAKTIAETVKQIVEG
ncbi:DegT/DnrJ/EryC1/StrS family aminotransferase [Pyrodictium delaneyi]|uniref:Aminotransferase DegT n=1 Tax=Pyrodictium delaneyi TaxID=1273541 RepID=A0A211YQT7_9CREN|nr:DegT/DnrJ/EryC1/StrS family aminotransferase [Pyrodictium delaneyi]OWJ55197.1 aminotransferase DegT [Pyrodictium delaneyi]